MDSYEPEDKILNVEEEFIKIAQTLHGINEELHQSQQNFLHVLTEIQQKETLIPSKLEILNTNTLSLLSATREIQQGIDTLNDNPAGEPKDFSQRFDSLTSDIQRINAQFVEISNQTKEILELYTLLKSGEPSHQELSDLQSQISQLNTELIGDREKIFNKFEEQESSVKETIILMKEIQNQTHAISSELLEIQNKWYCPGQDREIIQKIDELVASQTTIDNSLKSIELKYIELSTIMTANQKHHNQMEENIQLLFQKIDSIPAIMSEIDKISASLMSINDYIAKDQFAKTQTDIHTDEKLAIIIKRTEKNDEMLTKLVYVMIILFAIGSMLALGLSLI